MENDISQQPGMYYTPPRGQTCCECQSKQENTQKTSILRAPNLYTKFQHGWAVALGLHQLEEMN